MGVMRVVNKKGDVMLRWDREDPDGVTHARSVYQREVRERGGSAFRVGPEGRAERLGAFDPDAAEIVVVPAMAGGG